MTQKFHCNINTQLKGVILQQKKKARMFITGLFIRTQTRNNQTLAKKDLADLYPS